MGNFSGLKENFPGQRKIQKPFINQESRSTTEIFPQLFFGKRKVPHWSRAVYAFFFPENHSHSLANSFATLHSQLLVNQRNFHRLKCIQCSVGAWKYLRSLSQDPQPQYWIKFLDPWMQDFYPVLGWGLASVEGDPQLFPTPLLDKNRFPKFQKSAHIQGKEGQGRDSENRDSEGRENPHWDSS